jgi:hypothetical protein
MMFYVMNHMSHYGMMVVIDNMAMVVVVAHIFGRRRNGYKREGDDCGEGELGEHWNSYLLR